MSAFSRRTSAIQWSPHDSNRFAVAGSDLRVYEIVDDAVPQLRSIISSLPNADTLDWCPDPANADLIAVGTSTGKIYIGGMAKSEIVLRMLSYTDAIRSCRAIKWNTVNKNLLLGAYGRGSGRIESILLWDAMTMNSNEADVGVRHPGTSFSFSVSSQLGTVTNSEPVAALEPGSDPLALAWVPKSASSFVASFRDGSLRLLDYLDDGKGTRWTSDRRNPIKGVEFDPFDDDRFMTWSANGIILMWDVRNLSEPQKRIDCLVKQGIAQGTSQVSFCPFGRHHLCSIRSAEPVVRIWDVSGMDSFIEEEEDLEDGPLEPDDVVDMLISGAAGPLSFRQAAKYAQKQLATLPVRSRTLALSQPPHSLSWRGNSILTVSIDGTVELLEHTERHAISFAPNGNLAIASGTDVREECDIDMTNLKNMSKDELCHALSGMDISTIMRARAVLGYGHDPQKNKHIAFKMGHDQLSVVWKWIADCTVTGHMSMSGVIFTLTAPDAADPGQRSNTVGQFGKLVYDSQRRRNCLKLIGHHHEGDELETAVKKLEDSGQHERAASLSLMHLDLKRAAASLSESSSEVAALLAMLLSTASNIEDDRFREAWEPLVGRVTNPYIRAMVNFLSADSSKPESFEQIVTDADVLLEDRIAFGLRYLPDDDLERVLMSEEDKYVAQGDLRGLILCGIGTRRGVVLIQHYLNRTSDAQTAALILSFAQSQRNLGEMGKTWAPRMIEEYRRLLNSWEMWHERAALDQVNGRKMQPSIFLRCNFCNNSITMLSHKQGSAFRGRGRALEAAKRVPTVRRMISCPTCGRQLPRCCVCLNPITTLNPIYSSSKRHDDFDMWQTTCMNCHHGGHEACVRGWFDEHETCPVAGCGCQCCK